MKKILCVIALLLACVCVFAACKNNEGNNPQETSTTIDNTTPDTSVNQENYVPTEGILYEVSEDGTYAVVVGYEGTATEVKIAKTYNELPVTIIDSEAFYSCTSLTSVTIPDSVATIDIGAFAYCNSLTSVTIGNSVTSIGDYAFLGCDSLTSITIPDSVMSIGDGAFTYCISLTSILVANDNTVYQSIDGNLYSKDGKMLIAYAIGKTAKSFTIPDSVTSIGDYAFLGCDSLTSVTIPDSVTSIGNSAFNSCTSLTNVTIGNSVTSIGDYAFQSCSALTSVTIPDRVASIGVQAFCECTALTSVVIGDSVMSIDYSAFRRCYRLTSVTIGDSVTSISNYSFSDCDSLTSVTFANTNGWWIAENENATSGTDITAESLADPATAAEYLKSNYENYYWFRTE